MRLLALLVFAATPVAAEEWFQHSSGELRAFHGDWTAVCEDQGEGPCRVVGVAKDEGSSAFFDMRIAVHRIDNSPNWAVEVMDRNMPAAELTELTLDVDGDAVVFAPSDLNQGDFEGYNAVDSTVIRSPEQAADLVERMKAGNRVTMRYAPQGGGDGIASLSLRGITAALNAVEARVLARQE
ncbi:MAG: hypothetical protein AAF393_08435 [Pseudomonadota bacterium]